MSMNIPMGNQTPNSMYQFNHGFQGYTVQNIKVSGLFLIEEPGYEQIYTRPYIAEADYGMFDQLTPHLKDLTIPDVAGVVGSYIRPNMHSAVVAPIHNGWGTRRYRWTMQVQVTNQLGIPSLVILDGWTDYSDASLSGMIDPNMIFRINSVTETRLNDAVSHVPVPVEAVCGNTSVFRLPEDDISVGSYFLQRPGDIHALGSTATILNSSGGQFGMQGQAMTTLTGAADTDNRLHSSSARFGYDLLAAARYANVAGEDDAYREREVSRRLRPLDLHRNAFIALLNSKISNIQNSDTGSFTLKDVISIDPTVQERMHVQSNLNAIRYNTATDYSVAAQVAMMYSQAVPAYMSQYAMQYVEFYQDMTGEVFFVKLNSVIQNRDLTRLSAGLAASLKTELFSAASYNNQLPFSVKVQCRLYGDITVTLTDDTGRQHIYSYPAYASSTYAPQITGDLTGFMKLSGTFHEMMNEMSVQTNGIGLL